MAIHYFLLRNKLVDEPNTYAARVRARGTADLDYVIAEICKRETTVGEADVRSVMTEYSKIIEDLLQKGLNVIMPLVQYRASIRGNFDRASDGFDPSRHQLRALAIPTKRLQQALSHVQVVKEDPVEENPYLKEFQDVDSGAFDSILTPDGMGLLTGRRLRFDPGDPTQGIFFIDSGGGESRVEKAGKIMPAELVFVIPSLSPGDYNLEVRSIPDGSDKICVGRLAALLTVGV
jgi:hypothetical protein